MANGNMNLNKRSQNIDSLQLNAELRVCLLRAWQKSPMAARPLAEIARQDPNQPSEEIEEWLQCPLNAPVSWLVTVAHRVGATLSIAGIICGDPLKFG